MKLKRKIDWEKFVFIVVFLSLIGSIVYAIVNIVMAAPGASPTTAHGKLKSDYTLMLLQCILGILAMFLPSILSKRIKLEIPPLLYIIYLIFLFCAIYLGEVRSFYYRIPYWDSILHSFSGASLGALGFFIIDVLNEHEKVKIKLSPVFVAVFAFCFALSLGTIWEIYEFTCDGLLKLNMQKYMLEDGTPLVGRAALFDTMKDLIEDALGALVITLLEFFVIRKRQKSSFNS
ncbi:MAG: hypothetical protein Q8876_06830 [Bacillota bacterium]|nr:hypothetical protein [Bacillota bacterium]